VIIKIDGKTHVAECGPGWTNLVTNMINELMILDPELEFRQIKEKFGSLRVYTSFSTDEVEAVIDKYEIFSRTICDVCGDPGEMRSETGWYRVRCEEHK